MGAFDNYQTPKKSSAFDNYKSPAAAADSSYLADFARRMGNTFGVADKMIAQGRATLPMMYPWMFGQDVSVVNPGGAYDPATQEARAVKNLAEERAKTTAAGERLGPVASTAADIAGYVPLAVATGGAGLGPIATGAVGGALAGAGHSKAIDPVGIAKDAATSAAINAATAGAITKGGPYIPAAAGKVFQHFGPLGGASLGSSLGSPFGLGGVGGYLGGEAVRRAIPEMPWKPIGPAWPWSGANMAAQGSLSAQGW